MPNFVDTILSNPLYTAIAVILVLVLLYSLMKRIIKLILFVLVLLIAFVVYMHYTGGDVKDTLNKVKEKGEKLVK